MLIVLFCLIVVVGGVQYYSIATARQARHAFAYEDCVNRADGLVAFLTSHWKRTGRDADGRLAARR